MRPEFPGPSNDTTEHSRWQRIKLRGLTNAGNGVAIPVDPGVTDFDVVFVTKEQNSNYGLMMCPNWNTTFWVTDKSTTGFKANFGTVSPSDAFLDYSVNRSENS